MFTVLHDVFLSIKNLALVIFFHYTTKEISQWKLNVTYVFFLENEEQTSGTVYVFVCLLNKSHL